MIGDPYANFTGDPDLQGEAPAEGDIAWVWFKPPPPPEGAGNYLYAPYHPHCRQCDVYGVVDPKKTRRQCWCCGKFIPGPSVTPPKQSKLW